MAKDNILYGSVYVHDYEHSGDSRYHYNVLNNLGITNTNFNYNGDGCTAEIEFSVPYSKSVVEALKRKFNGSVSFVNLCDFDENRKSYFNDFVIDGMKLTSSPCIVKLPHIRDIRNGVAPKDWSISVKLTEYTSCIKREENRHDENVELFKRLGFDKVYFYFTNDVECGYVAYMNVSDLVKKMDIIKTLPKDKRFCFRISRYNSWGGVEFDDLYLKDIEIELGAIKEYIG